MEDFIVIQEIADNYGIGIAVEKLEKRVNSLLGNGYSIVNGLKIAQINQGVILYITVALK